MLKEQLQVFALFKLKPEFYKFIIVRDGFFDSFNCCFIYFLKRKLVRGVDFVCIFFPDNLFIGFPCC